MTPSRKATIKQHIERCHAHRRPGVLEAFTRRYGADHEQTRFARSLIEGAPSAGGDAIEADAKKSEEAATKAIAPKKPPVNNTEPKKS